MPPPPPPNAMILGSSKLCTLLAAAASANLNALPVPVTSHGGTCIQVHKTQPNGAGTPTRRKATPDSEGGSQSPASPKSEADRHTIERQGPPGAGSPTTTGKQPRQLEHDPTTNSPPRAGRARPQQEHDHPALTSSRSATLATRKIPPLSRAPL
jgi:hypothetical protein